MAVSVTLPALGESVTEGTVTRWLKAEGERVEADEPLLEVSTDKVDTEIPAPAVRRPRRPSRSPRTRRSRSAPSWPSSTTARGAPAAAPAPAAEAAAAAAPGRPAPAAAAPAAPAAPAPAPAAAAGAGCRRAGTDVVLPALGESRHRGHRHPLAEGGRRERRGRRAAAGGLHRQGRHRDPGAGRRHPAGDPGRRGRDRRGRRQAGRHRCGGCRPRPPPRLRAAPAPAPAPPRPRPRLRLPPRRRRPRPRRRPLRRRPRGRRLRPPRRLRLPPRPRPRSPRPPRRPRPAGDDGAYVTPLVRKLAAENGVDLASVQGHRRRRPDPQAGRLAAAEAAKAAAAAAPAAAPAAAEGRRLEASPLRGQTVKMTRMRKVIGDNMMKALHSPGAADHRGRGGRHPDHAAARPGQGRPSRPREGVKLSPMPFFVKAAAQALKAHPVVNARINEDEGTITYFDTENIGIAVDSEKGLMTPVIKGAGDLNIAGIAKKTAELAGKVRGQQDHARTTCRARPSRSATPVRAARCSTPSSCRPNQVGHPGHRRDRQAPGGHRDHPERRRPSRVRDMTYLSLSYDHRLVDGADAARYLTAVKADPGGRRVRGRARPVSPRSRAARRAPGAGPRFVRGAPRTRRDRGRPARLRRPPVSV